ncbi:unnamed protein product [Sphagnum troendelagicum]
MAVHFKFRSAMEYDSIDIDGPFIAIGGLKEKIVEHKNLRSATDIDLLITNAQTGEEYTDDSFLVLKNTSVIIKRVPASGPKPILPEAPPSEHSKATDTASQPPAFTNPVMDGMDDFGIDLYALPEPMPNSSSRIDADENSRIAAMVNNTASEWQRQTQEAFAGGRGYGRGGYGRGSRGFGRATPPQGYVCHRCGQPGHFIQHCPTNGDPTYDMRRMKPPVGIPKTRLKADQEGSYILPDGSVAVMQPDETVFAKEADALLAIRPILIEPPPELRCPLCKNIFKDAVMIPCCQYSFCDKCIREELIAKGKCPQCGSTKFKNDDLLPNINLRQAIDRFLEAQVTTSGASDSFLRQQQAPDVESGPRKVPTPAASRLQIELRKPSSSGGAAAVQPPAPMEPVLADSVVESIKEPETGLKEKEEDQAQGSAVLTVAAANAAEDSGDAIEGPLSTKDEVVGAETVVGNVGGLGRDEEEKPGFVFDEGEAGKMMSKSMEPTSFKEADGVAVESEVSKGGPMPPMGMPPYGGGGDMYWHGPPVPQQVHPFPGGYGENMHGPGPGPFHFDGPMMPGPQYGLPPYMPPMYHGGPLHGGMPGGMMGPMDRPPLSREEFMELQERQRRRRIMQEHPERSVLFCQIANCFKLEEQEGVREAMQLAAELCKHFYSQGWVSGTGGSITLKVHNPLVPLSERLIVMAPSGVQKERMLPTDMYVLAANGSVLKACAPKGAPHKPPKCSECGPLFLKVYQMRNAGAVIHSHGIEACLATMINPSATEFRITHMEMIKGIIGHGYYDELVVPIIENSAREYDLTDSLAAAMEAYPKATAVLVRNHGIYIWGDSWISAKTQAECYHYLFEAALRLHQLGLDPADPKHSPLLPHNSFEPSRPLVVPNVSSNKNGAKSNDLFSPRVILLDIEGTTTPISFVTDVLFPYAREHAVSFLRSTYDTDETQCDIQLLRKQVAEDLEQGLAEAVFIPPDNAGMEAVVSALEKNVQAMIKADRKITSLKQLQGHIWRVGYEQGELHGEFFDDVPEALAAWHASGNKTYIYSSGSREAQRLIFGNTKYGDLRQYLSGFFDTTIGNKREARSYSEICLTVGVDSPSHITFATDVLAEAVAAKQAGLQAVLVLRPGNAPLPPDHGFRTISSLLEL